MTDFRSIAALGAMSMGLGMASDDFLSPRVRYPQVRDQVDHYAAPKPLTKRQKRRLRGKSPLASPPTTEKKP